MAHSIFPRKLAFTGAPAVDFARVLGALLHLLIPVVTGLWMFGSHGGDILLARLGVTTSPLTTERALLYVSLDLLYGARWAVAMFIMLGEVTVQNALVTGTLHGLASLLIPILSVTDMGLGPRVPPTLTALDWTAAALAVLAAVLQTGSEAQRWLFRRDPHNKGKLHTTGLFRHAQFINHSGHMLHELTCVLVTRSPFRLLMFLGGIHILVVKVTPETVAHMRNKYGAAHVAYSKKTPSLFIPGVY